MTIYEILDTYWDEIRQGDKLITTVQAETATAIKDLIEREVIDGNTELEFNSSEYMGVSKLRKRQRELLKEVMEGRDE